MKPSHPIIGHKFGVGVCVTLSYFILRTPKNFLTHCRGAIFDHCDSALDLEKCRGVNISDLGLLTN